MRWLGQPIRILGHPISLGALLLVLGSVALLVPVWIHHVDIDAKFKLDYGDIISICAFVSTVVIAVFSIIPNLSSMAASSRSAHYAELDNMYLHLLTLAVERPHLRNPDADPSAWPPDYEPYAYMVWNFLETIHDRCAEDARLRDTWAPVLAVEQAIHRSWFAQTTVPYAAKEHAKFCVQFCDFIWRAFWLAEPGSPEARNWFRRSWAYRPELVIRADPAVAKWLDSPGDGARPPTALEPAPGSP